MTRVEPDDFDAIDRDLAGPGAAAAIDRLARILESRGDHRAMLDALLLRARLDLGLPPFPAGGDELAEPARSRFEERYIDAIRAVGGKVLDGGDIAAAWPYFRAIAEKEPVARAIERFEADPDDGDGDGRLGAVVDIAFQQGVHPRKGFDLILDHYGTCSAITAFDALPPDAATRTHAADRLVRRLHADLVANLRVDLDRLGRPSPPEEAGIEDLIRGEDALFADAAYHLDVSHLASTVRLSPLLEDPATIALAVDLTEYGRRLSARHQVEGDPPFDDHYPDHARYLRALLGVEPDAAVAHFRSRIGPAGSPDAPIAAQVVVRLLDRLGRVEEAFEAAVEHLAQVPEAALGCPGPTRLALRLGRLDRLADLARDRGDLVAYASARLGRPEIDQA